MSGRYPSHVGMQHHVLAPGLDYGLPLNISTLADIMKTAGYATHAIGKWHLGKQELDGDLAESIKRSASNRLGDSVQQVRARTFPGFFHDIGPGF